MEMKRQRTGPMKRCCYGLCRSETRSQFRDSDKVFFISFPKPCLPFRRGQVSKRQLKNHAQNCVKCSISAKWVKACGRSSPQFTSIADITKDTYICSLHFVGQNGPSEAHPDPISLVDGLSTEDEAFQSSQKNVVEKNKMNLGVSRILLSPLDDEEYAKLQENSTTVETIKIDTKPVSPTHPPANIKLREWPISNGYSTSEIDSPSETDSPSEIDSPSKQISKEGCDLSTANKYDRTASVVVNTEREKHKSTCVRLRNQMVRRYISIHKFETLVQRDERKCLLYTGFRFDQIKIILALVSPICEKLNYHKAIVQTSIDCNACLVTRKLTLMQQFLLVLTRLRRGLLEPDLAYRFNISVSLTSKIIRAWIHLLFVEFNRHLRSSMFPSRLEITLSMSELSDELKNVRVIIDCIEFSSQSSVNFDHGKNLRAARMSSRRLKVLIGVAPNGVISFISNVYDGSISDREMFIRSKLVENLGPGDIVLANREFEVRTILQNVGASLCVVPSLQGTKQLMPEDDMTKKIIVKQLNTFKQAIVQLKRFRILVGEIPSNIKSQISQIFFVCACLTNFQSPTLNDSN